MALTDTLKLIITADGAQASSQFKKVGADARASLSQAEGGSSKLQAAMGMLGPAAIAAGAAAVAFAKSSVDAYQNVGSEVLKLQRYTGGTAEETSRLRFAMQQAGVDVDAAAKSFGIFSKNIVNSPDAFAKYSIATQDATGKTLSFHDILLNTATQFQKMPNGAEKTAAALKLFGRAGADMIPFLNRGAAGIADLEKQTDKYGMVLSGKNLADVKANKEAQRQLNAAFQGLQVTLGKELLPTVTSFTKEITGMIKPVTALSDKLDSLSGKGGTLATVFKTMSGTLGDGGILLGGFRNEADKATVSTEDLAKAQGITTDEAQKFLDTQKNAGTTYSTVTEAQLGYTTSLAEGASATDDATDATVSYAEAMKRLNDAETALFDPQFALMDATQRLNELQASGTATSEELAKAALDVDAATRTLAAGMDNGSISVDKTRSTLNAWVLQGMLTSAQANDVAEKLGLVAARADALNGRTVTVSVLTQFANAVVDLQTVVGQGGGHQVRAHGGPVHRGESYIVGDRRGMDSAEVFTPSVDGYVHPNANGAMSGNTYNFSFPNYVGDKSDLIAAIREAEGAVS